MKEQLEYYIRNQLKNPKEAEIKEILALFELEHFQKGEYFKRHDKSFSKLGFLLQGRMQHYIVKHGDKEMTIRISQKDAFVTDILCLRTKAKTPISIKALEPTSMLVAAGEAINDLAETNLTLNRLLREYMGENIEKQAELYFLFMTGTAKERYKFILENNPELLKNTPLRFIASMIGITPTQLSRIRNKK